MCYVLFVRPKIQVKIMKIINISHLVNIAILIIVFFLLLVSWLYYVHACVWCVKMSLRLRYHLPL